MRERFVKTCTEYYVERKGLDASFFFEYWLEKGGSIKDFQQFASSFQNWVLLGGQNLVDNLMELLCAEFKIIFIKKGKEIVKVL